MDLSRRLEKKSPGGRARTCWSTVMAPSRKSQSHHYMTAIQVWCGQQEDCGRGVRFTLFCAIFVSPEMGNDQRSTHQPTPDGNTTSNNTLKLHSVRDPAIYKTNQPATPAATNPLTAASNRLEPPTPAAPNCA